MRRAVVVGGLVAAVVAGLVIWGLAGPDVESADTDEDSREPATPEGLAAAVDGHLAEGDLVTATDTSAAAGGHAGPELRVDLSYRMDDGAVDFSVGATEELTEWAGVKEICAERSRRDTCRLSRAADGSRMAVLHIAGKSRKAPGFSMVVVHRGDQIVFATETPRTSTGHSDLPVPVDTLEEILTDPLVGLSTSPELNAHGESLPFGA